MTGTLYTARDKSHRLEHDHVSFVQVITLHKVARAPSLSLHAQFDGGVAPVQTVIVS